MIFSPWLLWLVSDDPFPVTCFRFRQEPSFIVLSSYSRWPDGKSTATLFFISGRGSIRKLRDDRRQFWQDRYFDANILGETTRSEVVRISVETLGWKSVKGGLVAFPEQY
jgi:hypothetical protein